MDMIKWNPMKELGKLLEWSPSKILPEQWFEAKFPALDVEDKGDSFIVKAELPGITSDDISVELHGDTLTIKGEKKEEREEGNEQSKFYYKERSFGSFARTISIGEELDPKGVTAEFENGLLRITLKKSEAKKAKKIPIEVKKKQ
ncbi:MAG: Hsp20/alpha crystallin family protein [Planctomycetota bacterium]